jgi:hypothetical protein
MLELLDPLSLEELESLSLPELESELLLDSLPLPEAELLPLDESPSEESLDPEPLSLPLPEPAEPVNGRINLSNCSSPDWSAENLSFVAITITLFRKK